MICGLLGKTLGHSFSPMIHQFLGDYDYRLFEKSEAELPSFLANPMWHGLNVTIPYKKMVLPYLDRLSERARQAGSVNTIVRCGDGTLFGDNTDVYGFRLSVKKMGWSPAGKKVLVLGSGGASTGVVSVLKTMDAVPVVISRKGENHYNNLSRHRDARMIVNATPVGMFPHNGEKLIDLEDFPQCEGVLDLIYNPARTPLLLQAEKLGIPHMNGLMMLVAQAKASAEDFTGRAIAEPVIDQIYCHLKSAMENIILIGMPGVGKSTLAQTLGSMTGRPVYDSDDIITAETGLTPAQWITQKGEAAFRAVETQTIQALGQKTGAVIATGGGVVTRAENYAPLHQNGRMVWIQRPLSDLTAEERPLSQVRGFQALYDERAESYESFADIQVTIGSDPETSAAGILQTLGMGSD